MHADSEDAALVTSHLHHHHPHPRRRLCAQRSAAQDSAAPSSCHRPHWLTERQHVGAYLTDQPPSPPRRTEEPAIGGTADARWRSAAWAAPTRRDRPEERVSAITTGSCVHYVVCNCDAVNAGKGCFLSAVSWGREGVSLAVSILPCRVEIAAVVKRRWTTFLTSITRRITTVNTSYYIRIMISKMPFLFLPFSKAPASCVTSSFLQPPYAASLGLSVSFENVEKKTI